VEKPITILIPYYCYCSSKGALKRGNEADEKFKKAKFLNFSDLGYAKNLFNQKKGELYNPETFIKSILTIFEDFEEEYGVNSWIYINSFKRLISLTAKEMELPEIKINSRTFLEISELDVWFDFLHNLHQSISEIVGIYATRYFKNKRTAYCLVSETENGIEFLTEIMISDIKDYWDQQSF
jgi:hypothetical protein